MPLGWPDTTTAQSAERLRSGMSVESPIICLICNRTLDKCACDMPRDPSSLPASTCSETETGPRAEEIDVIMRIKLPIPVSAFVGAIKGLQQQFDEPLYIRTLGDCYEIFRLRADQGKSSNDV